MSNKIPHSDNPKIQEKIDKAVHRDSVMDHTLRWVLHYIERFIAVVTILALLGSLGLELYHMVKLQSQRTQQGKDGHDSDEPFDVMQHPAQSVIHDAVPVDSLVDLLLNLRIVGMGNFIAHR